MYYEETFVLIDPNLQERFLTGMELRDVLGDLLQTLSIEEQPQDLQNLPSLEQKIDRLVNTACDLDCGSAGVWQWYAVRLKKNGYSSRG